MANPANGKKKSDPRKVIRTERQRQALELRLAGLTFRAIGDKIGISHMLAKNLVDQSMREYAAEIKVDSETLRDQELKRLDALLPSVWIKARAGDIKAIDCSMRILERRSKLLGLEPAIKLAGHDGKALLKERSPYEFSDAELVAIITAAVSSERPRSIDGIPETPEVTH